MNPFWSFSKKEGGKTTKRWTEHGWFDIGKNRTELL